MLAKVNPPLRSREDQAALWAAISDGTIDTIGSDNYSWLRKEKQTSYNQSPSGLPNIELTLPMLLTAVKARRLSLERMIELTSANPARIFSIPPPGRHLFVDMDNPRPIRTELTDWHTYELDRIIGWPLRQREEAPLRH